MIRLTRARAAAVPLTREERTELERLMVKVRGLEGAIDALRPSIWNAARRCDALREGRWVLEEQVKDAEAAAAARLWDDRETLGAPPGTSPEPLTARQVLHAMTVALVSCGIAVKNVSSTALSDTLFLILTGGTIIWAVGWIVLSEIEAARAKRL